MSDENFKRELASAINRCGIDNDASVPDHILADVAYQAIHSFLRNARARDEWRGIPPWKPGQRVTVWKDLPHD